MSLESLFALLAENQGASSHERLPQLPCGLPHAASEEPHKSRGVTPVTSVTPKMDRWVGANQIRHDVESRLSQIVRQSGEVSEHDPNLRRKLHALFDRADELDRNGDIEGVVRVLGDVERLIQNGYKGKDEGMAAVIEPQGCNAKVGENASSKPVVGLGAHSELVTERAAIREYSGGQPRDQAEQDAAQEVGPCFLCGGGRFWVSTFGVIVCERCHPPATPKLVARFITLDAR